MSRVPEAIARIIAYSFDGDFHDGEGIFLNATLDGSTVLLTAQDAETDEVAEFILTLEAVVG